MRIRLSDGFGGPFSWMPSLEPEPGPSLEQEGPSLEPEDHGSLADVGNPFRYGPSLDPDVPWVVLLTPPYPASVRVVQEVVQRALFGRRPVDPTNFHRIPEERILNLRNPAADKKADPNRDSMT